MMSISTYNNSEIIDTIINVLSNKHDQYVIYRRLICGDLWRDLSIITKESKHYYERLCSMVYKKLEEVTNE